MRPVDQNYDKNNPLMTSAELLLGSEEAAKELGADLNASLTFSGLNRQQIISGEGSIPLHKVVNFLNHAAETTHCEHFGLLVAKYQPPIRFAMIGQLIRFSPDLGSAINDAIQFSILNSQYSLWSTESSSTSIILKRQERCFLDMDLKQLEKLALAVTYKAMNALCKRVVPLSQVAFRHDSPISRDALSEFFGAPILYSQLYNGLIIPTQALSTPIPTADTRIHGLLKAQLEELIAGHTTDLNVIEKLRLEILQTVGSRRCTLESICQNRGVHPRNLQRSLKQHGTSFRELLNDIRLKLAQDYLKSTDISVVELAGLLGYQNASALSRAFKQKTGLSPDHWRAR